jgi:hypothetical protein
MGDKAVERHVLALKRSDLVPVLRENAAEAGAQRLLPTLDAVPWTMIGFAIKTSELC